MLTIFTWAAIGFLFGSIPFSAWLTRFFLSVEIRDYGDGNPGAKNAWIAGGWPIGLAVLLLDVLKGALPVSLAHVAFDVNAWGLLPATLAPLLGHAYSPFLSWRGGKGLATTFGVWAGLTLGEVPFMFGLFLTLFVLVLDNDGWAVVLGSLGLLAHLLLNHGEPVLVALWLANAMLLGWKYRHLLSERPRFRVAIAGCPRDDYA